MSDKTVGDAVRLTRLALEMTPPQFGALVGVSRQTVSSWESDASQPSDELIGKWAKSESYELQQLARIIAKIKHSDMIAIATEEN